MAGRTIAKSGAAGIRPAASQLMRGASVGARRAIGRGGRSALKIATGSGTLRAGGVKQAAGFAAKHGGEAALAVNKFREERKKREQEQQKKAEERKRQQEEDRRRKEAEKKKRDDERRRAAEDRKRQSEERKKLSASKPSGI